MKTREWNLFNLLMKEPNKWFTKNEIVDDIYDYPESDRTNYSHEILNDSKKINASYEVDKIIICKNSQFKIATNEEAINYQRHFMNVGKKAFINYWAIDKKIKQDKQGKLISNQNKTIDEDSKAKLFYETFIKE